MSAIRVIAAISLLAACSPESGGDPDPDDPGADAAPNPDAPEVNASCFDNPPTAAPDPLAVDGAVVSLLGSDPIDGALVEARTRVDDSVVTDMTTGADGAFALSIDSSGAPWPGYFTVSAPGMFTNSIYFSGMVSESLSEEVKLADSGDITLLQLAIGQTIDTDMGLIIVAVYDCDGNPAAGAQVTLPNGGDVLYTEDDSPAPNATETDASGGALGLNVPLGDATVVVQLGDATIQTTVSSQAQSFTGLIVKP